MAVSFSQILQCRLTFGTIASTITHSFQIPNHGLESINEISKKILNLAPLEDALFKGKILNEDTGPFLIERLHQIAKKFSDSCLIASTEKIQNIFKQILTGMTDREFAPFLELHFPQRYQMLMLRLLGQVELECFLNIQDRRDFRKAIYQLHISFRSAILEFEDNQNLYWIHDLIEDQNMKPREKLHHINSLLGSFDDLQLCMPEINLDLPLANVNPVDPQFYHGVKKSILVGSSIFSKMSLSESSLFQAFLEKINRSFGMHILSYRVSIQRKVDEIASFLISDLSDRDELKQQAYLFLQDAVSACEDRAMLVLENLYALSLLYNVTCLHEAKQIILSIKRCLLIHEWVADMFFDRAENLEIALLMQIELHKDLNLLGSPPKMMYAAHAYHLIHSKVGFFKMKDELFVKIKEETSDKRSVEKILCSDPVWVFLIKRNFSDLFTDRMQKAYDKLEYLEDLKAELSDQEYKKRADAISVDSNALDLVSSLTAAFLNKE